MKSEPLVHRHPPTPPNFSVEQQNTLREIAQYNAERSFSFEHSEAPSLGYHSPGSVAHEGLSPHSSHVDNQPNGAFGLGVQYDEYAQGSDYYNDDHHNDGYNNVVHKSEGVFSGSPPTPRSVTEHDDADRRTRSGRTLASSSSPLTEEKPRPKAMPKVKRAKAAKNDKMSMPKLTAPLSVLTKDLTMIPLRNMEEWVNRSAALRRQEVEKRNGYVTRPMNSFMLYRSAYAERTKQWCLQNNHQVISSVSGESWPMEPPEIRDLYTEYAKIERINHQNAHPTYKFSPSKTTAPARKRKGEMSDEDEASDLDDAEWSPGQRRARHRHSSRPDRTPSYPTNPMTADYFDQSFGQNDAELHKPSWDMAHEGRPMPMPMAQGDMYHQYYQTGMHSGMDMTTSEVMDDMWIQRVDTPHSSIEFSPDYSLLGLPGGNTNDLMNHLHGYGSSVPGGESQVDPMLFGT